MSNKYRKLSFSMDEDGWLIIAEKTSVLLSGYSRRKWEESRVALTVEELEKALEYAKRERGGK